MANRIELEKFIREQVGEELLQYYKTCPNPDSVLNSLIFNGDKMTKFEAESLSNRSMMRTLLEKNQTLKMTRTYNNEFVCSLPRGCVIEKIILRNLVGAKSFRVEILGGPCLTTFKFKQKANLSKVVIDIGRFDFSLFPFHQFLLIVECENMDNNVVLDIDRVLKLEMEHLQECYPFFPPYTVNIEA